MCLCSSLLLYLVEHVTQRWMRVIILRGAERRTELFPFTFAVRVWNVAAIWKRVTVSR